MMGAMALLVIFVGFLIGVIGVGGVLLVPALVFIGGVEVHHVIPACMASFMLAGIVGVWTYGRRGSINWGHAFAISVGAVPGAYAGSILLSKLDSSAVLLIVASLTVLAGIDALRRRTARNNEESISRSALVVVGLLTGTGSALTGTGGPLIVVPILVWLGLPVLRAVGLGQFVQIPISAFATAGNLVHGSVDFSLAIVLAVLMALGLGVGARVAHSLPASRLKTLVALMLIVSGSAMASRLLGII